MKLKISINLLLFTSAIAHASPIIINSINLKVGETQRIELRSNPTTGYSWYPTKKIEKNPIITLVKSGYEADNTGLVGSGGIQFWEIRGKKAGSYTLTLQYKRPWEKKVKPVEVKKFVIEVQQKTT
jgi:inhibitor of cysteine peptidase